MGKQHITVTKDNSCPLGLVFKREASTLLCVCFYKVHCLLVHPSLQLQHKKKHVMQNQKTIKYCRSKSESNPMMYFRVSNPRELQWHFGTLRMGPVWGCEVWKGTRVWTCNWSNWSEAREMLASAQAPYFTSLLPIIHHLDPDNFASNFRHLNRVLCAGHLHGL